MSGVASSFVVTAAFLGAICYLLAYRRTVRGAMVCYSGLGDLVMASLWPIALPGGVFLYLVDMEWFRLCGGLLFVLGCVSLVWLVVVAFLNTRGDLLSALIAIGARIVVSLFLLLAVSVLVDRSEKLRSRGKEGWVGIAALLLLVAAGYRLLVRPLVGACGDGACGDSP